MVPKKSLHHAYVESEAGRESRLVSPSEASFMDDDAVFGALPSTSDAANDASHASLDVTFGDSSDHPTSALSSGFFTASSSDGTESHEALVHTQSTSNPHILKEDFAKTPSRDRNSSGSATDRNNVQLLEVPGSSFDDYCREALGFLDKIKVKDVVKIASAIGERCDPAGVESEAHKCLNEKLHAILSSKGYQEHQVHGMLYPTDEATTRDHEATSFIQKETNTGKGKKPQGSKGRILSKQRPPILPRL